MSRLSRPPIPVNRLTAFNHWVVYKLKDGRKVPYSAHRPFGLAAVNDPRTWATYEQARRALVVNRSFAGLGFVLTDSPYIAFDLDDVRNPRTGKVTAEARAIIEECDSYTEITPSGCGLRIIGTGRGDAVHTIVKLKTGQCEIYRRASRYICMTFDKIGDQRKLRNLDAVVDKLVLRKLAQQPECPAHSGNTKKKNYGTPEKCLREAQSMLDNAMPPSGDHSTMMWGIIMKLIDGGVTDREDIFDRVTNSKRWPRINHYDEKRLRKDITTAFERKGLLK
jgi:hypothetical protein